MCRQSDLLDARIDAARCLSDACETRLGTSGALQESYRRIAQEQVPQQFAELLARLGSDRGGT